MNTTGQPMPDTNDIEPRCSVCDHATASHDWISQRYCDATLAHALARKCICAPGPARGNPPTHRDERRFCTPNTRSPTLGPTATPGPTRRPADHLVDSSHTETRPIGGSMADVTEKLMHLFGHHLELPVIVAVVRQCWREAHNVTGPPRPDRVIRLADQRLTKLAEQRDHSGLRAENR